MLTSTADSSDCRNDADLTGFQQPTTVSLLAFAKLEKKCEGKSLTDKLATLVRKRKGSTIAKEGENSVRPCLVASASGFRTNVVPRFSSSVESLLESLGVSVSLDPLPWFKDDIKWRDKTLVKDSLPAQVLRSCILTFAEAAVAGDEQRSKPLQLILERETTSNGSPLQRAGKMFLEAITARAQGSGTDILQRPVILQPQELIALESFTNKLCCLSLWKDGVSRTLLNASAHYNTLHIIDFALWWGQWPSFIRQLAHHAGAPLNLRLTLISPPAGIPTGFGPFRPATVLEQPIREAAAQYGVSLEWQVITCPLQDLSPSLLNLRPNEALAVNCGLRLSQLSCVSTLPGGSPRDRVLRLLRALNPLVVTQAELNMETSADFFMKRISQALDLFSLMFDLEVARQGPSVGRSLFERHVVGRQVVNLVATEGQVRVVRHERVDSWQKRMWRAGVLPRDVPGYVKESLERSMLAYGHGKDISVHECRPGVMELKYKGHSICALMSWQPFERVKGPLLQSFGVNRLCLSS